MPDSLYSTLLGPAEEWQFNEWVRRNNIPFDSSSKSDYDMRGFWKAAQRKDPRAHSALNSADGFIHYPDTWKTPFHKTFSNESIYASPNAPRWVGDKLINSNGRVIADESPSKNYLPERMDIGDLLESVLRKQKKIVSKKR